MEEIRWRTEVDHGVWDGNCDTAISDGGRVATIPTDLKVQWFTSQGYIDSDEAIRGGWAFVTFIGRIERSEWNLKIVVPDVNKDHIVFALIRQYIVNKFNSLLAAYPKIALPHLDVQIYCFKSQTIQRIKNSLFWLKTGCLHKNGLTQLTDILDEVHTED